MVRMAVYCRLVPLGTFFLALSLWPAPLVTLTVEERGGMARRSEPLTAGVPLPKGRVRDAALLTLLDERSRSVAAHIKPVNKWWDDGSIKWVHVHFQTDVPAGGKRVFALVNGKAGPRPRTALTVTDQRDSITIVTGPLRFVVKKSGFNGIDQAWLDGAGKRSFDEAHRMVAPHRGGLILRAGGREYASSRDAQAQVVVEEQTPLYAVIKATGALTAEDGSKGFSYICRLTAWANRPSVAAQVTVVNTMGPERRSAVSLERLAWELPATFPASRVLVGGENEVHATRLESGQSAWIYQRNSGRYELGGELSGSGGGKSSKPLTTGWASLGDGKRGLAAGVRSFWQTHPKAIEATGNGKLSLELYSSRAEPLDIYTGVSRTHDLLFLFHDEKSAEDELRDAFAAFQQPLRAVAPLRWYTRDTRAFGNLVEADPSLFGRNAAALETYLEWWTANFDAVKRYRDGRTIRGVFRDAYGWLEFGDGLHYVWEPGNDTPRNIAWAGNYYDFPRACLLHFLLTGRWDFFDFFLEHARQLADVHFVHYDPDPELIGSNRYCPPTDHVRIDPKTRGDYRTAEVYVSNTFNHHKTQSLFESYLLTGDRHALDVARMGLEYAHNYRAADGAYNQPRGPGHQILTLLAGYELTGDRKYLERCRHIIDLGRKAQLLHAGGFAPRPGQFFQFGITLEALIEYYRVTNDESIVPMVRAAMDFLLSKGRRYANCAYAAGFLWSKTGERKYFEYGVDVVSGREVFEHPVKNSGLAFRSTPYFLYYLAGGKE